MEELSFLSTVFIQLQSLKGLTEERKESQRNLDMQKQNICPKREKTVLTLPSNR